MSDTTIRPDDLQMYRIALEQAQAAEQQLQRAQQAFGQAQQQHIAAIGALQFTLRTIQARPGFPEGGSFHPETGAIVVPLKPEDVKAQHAVAEMPQTRPAADNSGRDIGVFGRRKKGA